MPLQNNSYAAAIRPDSGTKGRALFSMKKLLAMTARDSTILSGYKMLTIEIRLDLEIEDQYNSIKSSNNDQKF